MTDSTLKAAARWHHLENPNYAGAPWPEPWPTPWPLWFVLGEIKDYRRRIQTPLELGRWAEKRELEFAAGRFFAERALSELGCEAPRIPSATNRAPVWPEGFLGSISHSDRFAWVVVTPAQTQGGIRSIGLDMERCERIEPKLFSSLFTPNEIERYSHGPQSRWVDVVFSAKEAVYKAVNPIVGKFIGFHEVEVDLADREFSMRYVGDHEPNRIMEAGRGYFEFYNEHVLTLFVLPSDTD